MIRAIVFDLDGVLVDAAPWHYQALATALSVFGYHIPADEHERRFNGLPTYEKLKLLSAQTAFPKKLHKLVNDLKQKYTDEIISTLCRPNPVITELLQNLSTRGYRLACASNSRRSTVDAVLDRMQIRSFFELVLSHEQVPHPKPAPDIYHAVFQKLGIPADHSLIVEDSPVGVQSARAAGSVVLQVSTPDQVNIKNLDAFLSSLENRPMPLENARKCLQILVPMAGEGTRFQQAGYTDPKPFIPVENRPMIQWVVDNVRPRDRDYRFLFLCQKKHLDGAGRNSVLDAIAPKSTLIPVPGLTQGAACTALLASDSLDENSPLLLVNSDQYVDFGITEFLKFCSETECDGAILTFPANEKKWSYAQIDAEGRVARVAEKDPISPHATVGIYYFRRAGDFLAAAREMIARNIRTNGEFYACPVYNLLIEQGRDVRIFSIEANQMHGLGTPEDLMKFLQSRAEKF